MEGADDEGEAGGVDRRRWQEDCLRRKLSTAERRERREVEEARKTTASLVQ
jgi:hypothetical protein